MEFALLSINVILCSAKHYPDTVFVLFFVQLFFLVLRCFSICHLLSFWDIYCSLFPVFLQICPMPCSSISKCSNTLENRFHALWFIPLRLTSCFLTSSFLLHLGQLILCHTSGLGPLLLASRVFVLSYSLYILCNLPKKDCLGTCITE